jgi:hypothetical protein
MRMEEKMCFRRSTGTNRGAKKSGIRSQSLPFGSGIKP